MAQFYVSNENLICVLNSLMTKQQQQQQKYTEIIISVFENYAHSYYIFASVTNETKLKLLFCPQSHPHPHHHC